MDFDVNEELPERDFSTPLHLAVASGREDFVSVLLRHPKIDPNRPNRTGKRFPLHVAAEKGQARLVLPLLRSGADPDARMENGSSALHVLAARSAARWVQDEGLRPTVRREFVECARMLLEAVRPGANIDATNSIGVTPVAMAVEKGSQVNVKGGRRSKIFCGLFHFLYCDLVLKIIDRGYVGARIFGVAVIVSVAAVAAFVGVAVSLTVFYCYNYYPVL